MSIKILWLCNIVLPDFSEEFGIKKSNIGGWMTGMLRELEKDSNVKIAITFPIIDEWRMRDGEVNGHPYYSFSNSNRDEYEIRQVRKESFERIILDFNPDLVHIWGSEYPWALEMADVCEQLGMIDKVIVHIQGLVSVCANHYLSGIPEHYCGTKGNSSSTLKYEQEVFRKRGDNEICLLNKVYHVDGRTDWDKACCYAINQKLIYHKNSEILRSDFYDNIECWKYNDMNPHTIFFSQAGYPIKGFHYLIEALSIVVKEYPDTVVNVGGPDIINAEKKSAYASFICDLLDMYGLQNNIDFLGQLSSNEMIMHYKRSHIFVCSSSIENSCNSLLEAMMIGTPVVVSYVGGMTSYIKHNINSLSYPENEPALLAYYIMQLFKEKDLCESISAEGIKTAQVSVSKEQGKRELLGIYYRLSEKKKI